MSKTKTAIITGSTSGMGLGIARALADDGVNIVLNGFGEEAEIKKLVEEISDKGVKCHHNPADVSQANEIRQMVNDTANTFGSVDIMVNNVGVQYVCPIDEYPEEQWDRVINLCLNSTFHGTKAAVAHMKKNGWGRIINMASALGLTGHKHKCAYTAAKHGVIGFTKAVAMDLADMNITVNAICPGYVETAHVEQQLNEMAKSFNKPREKVKEEIMLEHHARKEFVTVEEVALMTAFLCSEKAVSITGASHVIDCGWTAS